MDTANILIAALTALIPLCLLICMGCKTLVARISQEGATK